MPKNKIENIITCILLTTFSIAGLWAYHYDHGIVLAGSIGGLGSGIFSLALKAIQKKNPDQNK